MPDAGDNLCTIKSRSLLCWWLGEIKVKRERLGRLRRVRIPSNVEYSNADS